MASRAAEAVEPARLSYLTIYNPALGPTDETLPDQIVFYYSGKRRRRRGPSTRQTQSPDTDEDRNERLRQVGLAQGTVEFARSFANGDAVGSVDTEKSRIVLHELEAGWWILASIRLTRLPSQNALVKTSKEGSVGSENRGEEYSAREVCPGELLIQHLLRAHSIFLLHHASSLEDLYRRLDRPAFCSALDRFWLRFIKTWEVMLDGNPAVDIFRGIKLAACGELGVGVGEEEWGSGEREVLEGLVERTDGMIDLMVSRFDASDTSSNVLPTLMKTLEGKPHPTYDTMQSQKRAEILPTDGVIFSGVNILSKESRRAVSSWIEWIHLYGSMTYGVKEDSGPVARTLRHERRWPSSGIRSNSSMRSPQRRGDSAHSVKQISSPPIPPPVFRVLSAESTVRSVKSSEDTTESNISDTGSSAALGSAALIKYLTLGYGSSWGYSTREPTASPLASEPESDGKSSRKLHGRLGAGSALSTSTEGNRDDISTGGVNFGNVPAHGHFVIGLREDKKKPKAIDANDDIAKIDTAILGDDDDSGASIISRTVHVTVETAVEPRSNVADDTNGPGLESSRSSDPAEVTAESRNDQTEKRQLRVVVYSHAPFLFVLLFELDTQALALPSFYQDLQRELNRLITPLRSSTSPLKVAQRIANISPLKMSVTQSQSIYDLIYDPATLLIHSSVPSIPEVTMLRTGGSEVTDQTWSRIEALSTHTQILYTFISTRRAERERERTCKTSRGWWVAWMRLPASSDQRSEDKGARELREAFLIRRASDQTTSGYFGISRGRNASGSSAGDYWAPGKLVDGLGIDTRRYIEGILSLNR